MTELVPWGFFTIYKTSTFLFNISTFSCCCISDAYENACNLCHRYYMNSPELILEEFNGNCTHFYLKSHTAPISMCGQKCECCFSCVSSAVKGPDKPIAVVYVPSHLYHMVFELFKVLYFSSHCWTVEVCICQKFWVIGSCMISCHVTHIKWLCSFALCSVLSYKYVVCDSCRMPCALPWSFMKMPWSILRCMCRSSWATRTWLWRCGQTASSSDSAELYCGS